MRALFLLVLVLTACTTQPNAATSQTPSPTASATATPTQTPTSSPTPSPSPIALPSFAQLSAPSTNVVWVLVGGTRLFRSSDRGDTWIERSLPAGVTNTEVAFSDGQTGDLLRDHGLLLSTASPATQCQGQMATIWQTSDGAGQWQKVSSTGIADAMCKGGLAVADASHAFFTTKSPNAGSLIYRTVDAGATWTASATLPIPPNLASHGALGVQITSRPRGFGSVVLVAGGAGQTKDVFRSTDGGATFAYASNVAADGTVAYATATRWLDIGPSSVMETTDGGATWHPFTTDYSQAAPVAPEIVFGDAQVGYATVRGAIQRTTDGGAHWTTIKTPGTV
jgi:photosystem II stability/assembly factor-like uncharacterized protein